MNMSRGANHNMVLDNSRGVCGHCGQHPFDKGKSAIFCHFDFGSGHVPPQSVYAGILLNNVSTRRDGAGLLLQ